MSTRSSIGILKKDGTIDSIYCHLDGYPEGVGYELYTQYRNEYKLKQLLNLGDISHLEDNLNPNPNLPHLFGFGTEQDNVVVAYHRDRNEDWKNVKPKQFKNLDEYETYCKTTDQEYSYLFDEKTNSFLWSEIPYGNDKMDFTSLKDKLNDLGLLSSENEKNNLIWDIVDYEKENDHYAFIDEYETDEKAFVNLKSYFDDNGFEGYLKQLEENIANLEEDKNDLILGKLYNHTMELITKIEKFEKEEYQL